MDELGVVASFGRNVEESICYIADYAIQEAIYGGRKAQEADIRPGLADAIGRLEKAQLRPNMSFAAVNGIMWDMKGSDNE